MRDQPLTAHQRKVLYQVVGSWRERMGDRHHQPDGMTDEQLLRDFDYYRGSLKDLGHMDAIYEQRQALLDAGLVLLPEDRIAASQGRSLLEKLADAVLGRSGIRVRIGEDGMTLDKLREAARDAERARPTGRAHDRGMER